MNLIYSLKDVLSCDIEMLPRYNLSQVTPARDWESQNIRFLLGNARNLFLQCGIE